MTQPARAHEPEPSWHGYDPTDPDQDRIDDPFPHLARMRADWPVNETPAGLWRLFRYADCVRVLRELPSGVRRADGSSTGMAMGGAGPSGGQFMLQQDPPNHTRLRKLVSKAFTPRAVEALAPARAPDRGRAARARARRGALRSRGRPRASAAVAAHLRDARRAERRPRALHGLDGRLDAPAARRVPRRRGAHARRGRGRRARDLLPGADRGAARPARRRPALRADPRRGGRRPALARGAADPVDRAARGRLRDHGGPDRARREEPDRPSRGAREAARAARSWRRAPSRSACASRARSG